MNSFTDLEGRKGALTVECVKTSIQHVLLKLGLPKNLQYKIKMESLNMHCQLPEYI